MPKENKRLAIFFWVCVGLCMATIFYFSSKPADASAQQSDLLQKIIEKIFGINETSSFIVRKLAHFCEFLGLSLLLNCAMYFSYSKTKPIVATAIASLYAITDEVHQIFVEGRSCEFTDWLIDTAGAITGLIIFAIMYIIISRIWLNSNNRRIKK